MPSFPTAKQALQMRAQLAYSYDRIGIFLTPTSTINSTGSEVQTWVTLAASVPCRLSPLQRRVDEVTVGGSQESTLFWNLYFDIGITTLQDKDRVVIINDHGDSEDYEVIGSFNPRSTELSEWYMLQRIRR